MKSVLIALFAAVFAFKTIEAQVFTPYASEKTDSVTSNAKKTPAVNKARKTSPSSPKIENAKPKQPDNSRPVKTDRKTAPNVVTNFDGSLEKKQEEKKYDNSERKVFNFKVVDGKVVFDNNAPRTILISYGNYEVNQGFDGMVRCSIRLYVLNDLTERITNFSFKLHWPELMASVQMNRLNPGVRTYKDIILLGKGCFNMDKTPTIEVNRCRVKGMSQEQCADAVRWSAK